MVYYCVMIFLDYYNNLPIAQEGVIIFLSTGISAVNHYLKFFPATLTL